MDTVKAGIMVIRGTEFEIELHPETHTFQAYLDGEAVSAPSWAGLYDLLFKVTARHATSICVPITELRRPYDGPAAVAASLVRPVIDKIRKEAQES